MNSENYRGENEIVSDKSTVAMHVAVVMLNFNSEKDLMISAPQIAAQTHVKSTLILVDNASLPECVENIRIWLLAWRPYAVIGTQAEVDAWVENNPLAAGQHGCIYFIMNHENRGYSAGNNIGIRLADRLGANAVLIANPDMRIENINYLEKLTNTLSTCEKNYVVASRIVGLDGKEQNPQRESSYFEELLWPYLKLRYFLTKKNLVCSVAVQHPITVKKVSGCCQLLSMDFLKMSNFLDEKVFLYCEEPILSAKIKKMDGKIIFDPAIVAIHAHSRNRKGSSAKAALSFIKSRKYYTQNYSEYNYIEKKLLMMSYATMNFYYQLRYMFEILMHIWRK